MDGQGDGFGVEEGPGTEGAARGTGRRDGPSGPVVECVRKVPVLAWLMDDVPCHAYPVPDGGMVAETVAAYRQAQAAAGVVMAELLAAGFTREEFPQFTASLDAWGRPVVVLGPVRPVTAARLVRIGIRPLGPDGGRVA